MLVSGDNKSHINENIYFYFRKSTVQLFKKKKNKQLLMEKIKQTKSKN